MKNTQVQIFESQDGQAQLEVALDKETVWLSQEQMAELKQQLERLEAGFPMHV